MTYLDSILTASTSSSLDESVAGIDHTADTVGVGVKLSLEGLVLLVLALIVAREGIRKIKQISITVMAYGRVD